MVNRILHEFDEYKYGPRSVLRRGDLFRVKGGPVYVNDDGIEYPMYERGIFVFRRYCEQGAAKWIQAYHANGSGVAILWVGRSIKSPGVPGLRRKPYRVTSKLRDKRRACRQASRPSSASPRKRSCAAPNRVTRKACSN